MNELLGLPCFRPPAALALPTAELRIVAKYTPAPITTKPRTPTKMFWIDTPTSSSSDARQGGEHADDQVAGGP